MDYEMETGCGDIYIYIQIWRISYFRVMISSLLVAAVSIQGL